MTTDFKRTSDTPALSLEDHCLQLSTALYAVQYVVEQVVSVAQRSRENALSDTFSPMKTLQRSKTQLRTETFEVGFKSGDFWKCIIFNVSRLKRRLLKAVT